MKNINQLRRDFLKFSILSPTAFNMIFPQIAAAQNFFSTSGKNKIAGYDYSIKKLSLSQASSKEFNGDNINRPHDILWNVDGYVDQKGGWPQARQKTKIVVVGGGMSGLLSAYFLKEHKPLLLEQDTQLGGNSKGEVYNKSIYSIGAAYITVPDAGSSIETLLQELKLDNRGRIETDVEVNYSFKNEFVQGFWEGTTDPERVEEFQAVAEEMKRIYDEEYPDIPWTQDTAMSLETWQAWDNISFEQWLNRKWPKLHPHILEFFQIYAWSSFNGSIDEISATQMLNFITAETVGVMAFAGGNSLITYQLQKMLEANRCPVESGAFVIRVETSDDGVIVTYEDVDGILKAIECEYCVIAAPKFVAEKIVPELAPEQLKLIERMSYRGYIVANVILDKVVPSVGYDIFALQGEKPETPGPLKPSKRGFTDICFGSWAQHDEVEESILTIYKPLPFDGARQFLFNPGSHDKNIKQIMPDLEFFLDQLNLSMNDVKGIRMTRWGHSLPVAKKGLLASGDLETMCEPIGHRIFFANQDNFANPAFESCVAAAEIAAAEIENQIR